MISPNLLLEEIQLALEPSAGFNSTLISLPSWTFHEILISAFNLCLLIANEKMMVVQNWD
jgi:hypothetical protein